MIFGGMHRKGDRHFNNDLVELSVSNTITQYIPADKKGHWRDDKVALVQHLIWNTKESRSDQCPTIANDGSGLVVTAWARIDNRDELGSTLGLNPKDPQLSDTIFILKSYQKWGEDCVLHLIGDFVFVIYDPRQQKLFCARDHMGVRPFYYHLSDKHFIFSSGLNVFVELPGFEPEKSQKWMAEYLVGVSMSFTNTAYNNIKKLAPAHCLTITAERYKFRQYFQFSPETTLKLKDSHEYVDAYREQLEIAIRCRLRSEYMIGSELTGGIDSSTVTSFSSRLMSNSEENLHTFSFIGYEHEVEYIGEVLRSSGIRFNYQFSHHNRTTEERCKEMMHAIGILACPVEYRMSISHDPFYVKAKNSGIRTMLSGFGGDEFVTSAATVVLTEWLHKHKYVHLYKNLEGSLIVKFLRLMKRILNQVRNKNIKYNPFYYDAVSERWPYQLVKKELVDKYNLYSQFFDVARFDAGYIRLNDFILGNRNAPFLPTRLESCSLLAAARKIEYRWPLLDVRLIKLFLSIPSEEKYENGMGRLLHRRAINDVLPEKVVWKKNKSMGEYISARSILKVPLISFAALEPTLIKMLDNHQQEKQIKHQKYQEAMEPNACLVQSYRNAQNLLWLDQWLKGS